MLYSFASRSTHRLENAVCKLLVYVLCNRQTAYSLLHPLSFNDDDDDDLFSLFSHRNNSYLAVRLRKRIYILSFCSRDELLILWTDGQHVSHV